MGKYGYFDAGQREYVITNPKTPVKWINYVGTLAFGGFVDHTGGALICRRDPALNRITKYIPQLPAAAFKGTTLYLRVHEAGGYKLFSPFFVPTLDPYTRFECHVGLGYTRWVTEFHGIRTDATLFVPPGEERLLCDYRITNLRAEAATIDAVPVVEYTHPDALKQFTNADWVPQTMQSAVHRDPGGGLILAQFPFMRKAGPLNYLTSNLPASSFDTDRSAFLGENEYATWAAPQALQRAELSDSVALRGDNVGALMHHLGALAPGATARLLIQLGQADSLEEALPEVQRYRDPEQVQAALRRLRAFWDGYLARLQVRTPDASMDHVLNVHNPYQCYITKNWSRYLSLYQLGLGARGMGFRDSAQDVMGMLSGAPQEGKALLRLLLQFQERDGSAMHQFNPLTMLANAGDAREEEKAPQYYSDDHLWLVLAVAAYLKETGDTPFLQEEITFYDLPERPHESASVWEHLRRALAFTRGDLGGHGLPLAGFADWNDTVNLRRGAESLFTAHLYGKALREMIDLARFLGDEETASGFEVDYTNMKERVNAHAWDGGWYVRYFDAAGEAIGSQANSQGQIFANAQSWPVIAGWAPLERARMALEAVHDRLNTRHGIKLSTPGYDGYDPEKGGVTTYPPGAKENGGIFCHANPWVMIAETLLGDGDRAYEYYRQINPVAKNDQIDVFECEPYVYPQNILGDEHPRFGLARNSWLTGTASWCYQAGTQYILGVRPAYAGLQIDPCIPRDWDGFSVTRHFRGAVYEVRVENPDHVSKGVRSLVVDGEAIDGDVVPAFEDGQVHQVEVILGER
jgi:cellobiose phosphorylase